MFWSLHLPKNLTAKELVENLCLCYMYAPLLGEGGGGLNEYTLFYFVFYSDAFVSWLIVLYIIFLKKVPRYHYIIESLGNGLLLLLWLQIYIMDDYIENVVYVLKMENALWAQRLNLTAFVQQALRERERCQEVTNFPAKSCVGAIFTFSWLPSAAIGSHFLLLLDYPEQKSHICKLLLYIN